MSSPLAWRRFIVPQAKLDLYPLQEIELPADQQPPRDMPPIAWSNSGELVRTIHSTSTGGPPGYSYYRIPEHSSISEREGRRSPLPGAMALVLVNRLAVAPAALRHEEPPCTA